MTKSICKDTYCDKKISQDSTFCKHCSEYYKNNTKCNVCKIQIKDCFLFCKGCNLNSSITITQSDAKRKFGLTDDEIKNSNIYIAEIDHKKKVGKKHIVSEVIELADKLTKVDGDNSKRRKKFIKQQLKFKNMISDDISAKKESQIIMDQVNMSIEKIDYDLDIESHEIQLLIGSTLKDNKLIRNDKINTIIEKLEIKCNEKKRIDKVKKFIDNNKMNNIGGKEFMHYTMSYHMYIMDKKDSKGNNVSYDQLVNELKCKYNKEDIIYLRRMKIQEAVQNKLGYLIPKHGRSRSLFQRMSKKYTKCMDIDFEQIVITIVWLINNWPKSYKLLWNIYGHSYYRYSVMSLKNTGIFKNYLEDKISLQEATNLWKKKINFEKQIRAKK
jgi:hypothetical protein